MNATSQTRRLGRAASLWAALVGAAWVAALFWTGGFDVSVLGLTISAHDPVRPLIATLAAAAAFWRLGGTFRHGWAAALGVQRIFASGWLPTASAGALAALVAIAGVVYGEKAAGGSDSFGYVSQADLWLRGSLHVDQPFAGRAPWPDAAATFSPLGFKPSVDGEAIVPTYSPGFPLLLAATKAVAGDFAKYLVVPLMSGVLVLATFGIARRLASPAAGVVAAWLVATSPVVLAMTMATMSDVPTAACWAAAFYLMFRHSRASALSAGALAGLALLIRPNLLWLVPVFGVRYLADLAGAESRREAAIHGVLFALPIAAAGLADAAINDALFGSPFVSGYGPLSDSYALDRVGVNLPAYFSWLVRSHTPVVLAGAAALVIPSPRVWPRARRVFLVVAAASVIVVWCIYQLYLEFGTWFYLRFMLSSWPFMMAGTGALAAAALRRRSRMARAAVMAIVLAAGVYQVRFAVRERVFDGWIVGGRYIRAAQMARRLTGPNAVILAMQHSGSLRYYGGRMTLRYDLLGAAHIDEAVAWLSARGVHVYLLGDDPEIDYIQRQFAGTRTAAALTRPPVAVYEEPGDLSLFDISTPRAEGRASEFLSGVDDRVVTPGPAPMPRLVLRQ